MMTRGSDRSRAGVADRCWIGVRHGMSQHVPKKRGPCSCTLCGRRRARSRDRVLDRRSVAWCAGDRPGWSRVRIQMMFTPNFAVAAIGKAWPSAGIRGETSLSDTRSS
jgi:hypothetical protein